MLAVVAHAEFLSQLLQLSGDCQEDPRITSMFQNCEMRGFVMTVPYTPFPAAGEQAGNSVMVGPTTSIPGAGERHDPSAFPGGYACLE